jgi:hypothetical protein
MSLTFSNRETFLVLQWIEDDAERLERCRALARQLAKGDASTGIPRLGDAILTLLQTEVPSLQGIARELLESGMRRVNYFELALAFIQDAKTATPMAGLAAA